MLLLAGSLRFGVAALGRPCVPQGSSFCASCESVVLASFLLGGLNASSGLGGHLRLGSSHIVCPRLQEFGFVGRISRVRL